MSDANFSSILDKPSAEIQAPKSLPVGHYVFLVKGMPRIDKSSKKQTEFSEYEVQPLQALDDVDADDLAAYGSLGERTMKHTYYHTENSIYMLKKFLTDLGVEDDDDMSTRQRMEQVAGRQFVGQVIHEASQDGTRVYAKIKDTKAVD